jgi:Domain of unknown function (DUF4328)
LRSATGEKRRAMFAGATTAMLVLDAAFAVFAVIIVTKHPIPRGPTYLLPATRPDLNALSVVYFGLTVATAVCWIGWQRLAHRTLIQRGVWGRQKGPDAIWWWLVPLVNLIAGPRAVREIARHVPRARRLGVAGRDRLIRIWWLLLVIVWLGPAGQGTWELRVGSFGVQAPLAPSWMLAWGTAAILAALVVATIESGLDNVLPWTDPTAGSKGPSVPRRLGQRLGHRQPQQA